MTRAGLRGRAGGVPHAAWWCAAIAFVNVAIWGVLTPPFHVPDETAHVAYVQHLAENGEAPNSVDGRVFSDEQARLLDSLLFGVTVGRANDGTVWSEVQNTGVKNTGEQPLRKDNGGGIQANSNQPPLYYMINAGVYWVSPWNDLLDRLALMRLLSAFLAALTTLFVFFFLREVLAERWTWTVGALAVAFQPTFGFISGGVNPDALLFTISAALFYFLARAFGRGFTSRRALGIGAVLSIGGLTKLNFLALVPGALLGLGLLVWKSSECRLPALRYAVAAIGCAAAAGALYVGVNVLLWDRDAFGGGLATATTNVGGDADGVASIGIAERLSYTWQLYVPRLPFMIDQFDYFPPYTTWFKGGIGVFGWVDTAFAGWVYTVALWITIPLAILAVVALVQRRAVLVKRWPELLAYGAMAAGLLVSIGLSGSRYRKDTGFVFEQTRYLLPLLPLYATGVALAALGAGKRIGRPLGAALIILAMGHSLFAQLLIIARFYG